MRLRAVGSLPDFPAVYQAILAYASDLTLLGTALLPHGMSFFQPDAQAASLDHAMWFHRLFRIDDWLLYAMDCPSTRMVADWPGSIFSCDGRLIDSMAQEGVIRRRRK